MASKEARRLIKTLVTKARAENLGPDDAKIYVSKMPASARTFRGEVVARQLNAIAIPEWWKVTFKKNGAPFKYNGYMTRRYTLTSFTRMLGIGSVTFYSWRKAGYVPEPFLTLQGANGQNTYYWLYHQVQPVFSWYMHMKSRGVVNISSKRDAKALRELHRMKRQAEKRFLAKLGEDYIDPYVKKAGKYGVIWKTGPYSVDVY